MKRSSKTIQPSELGDLCTRLAELGVHRSHYIRAVTRETNSVKGLVRRALGFQWDLGEKERESINRRAQKIVAAALNGEVPDESNEQIALALNAPIEVTRLMCEPAEAQRHVIELEMRRLARSLPVWSWAETIKGFSDLGLAIIVAEAGDLNNYSTEGKLRKRLGLAPIAKDGVTKACSTWRKSGGLTADDWKDKGPAGPKYKPRRRAAIFAQVGGPLIGAMNKGPRPVVGEDTSVRPDLSLYQKIFIERLRHEAARDPEKMGRPATKEGKESFSKWAAMRAQRYTEQRLLKHLRQAWRRASEKMSTDNSLSAADSQRQTTAALENKTIMSASRSAISKVNSTAALPSAPIPVKAGKRRARLAVTPTMPLPAATSSAQAERSANPSVKPLSALPSASIPVKAGRAPTKKRVKTRCCLSEPEIPRGAA